MAAFQVYALSMTTTDAHLLWLLYISFFYLYHIIYNIRGASCENANADDSAERAHLVCVYESTAVFSHFCSVEARKPRIYSLGRAAPISSRNFTTFSAKFVFIRIDYIYI